MSINVKKEMCCGCTACASICPKNAITMIEDEEGFKYPTIDMDTCVSCGLCEKVCPTLNSGDDREKTQIRHTFGVKHYNPDILKASTSGGMFTTLSDYILSLGGVIYGAAFDDTMTVRHIRAESTDERNRMRGSKYVQSDLSGIYRAVKQDLAQGMKVLFTGTPCQVEGLKRYLHYKTDNLLCVDLICHGTPSPKILKETFKVLEEKNHSKLTNYIFRPKQWTWHVHREMAVFENGKKLSANPWTDVWTTIYYLRMAMRPSCHNCQFSNLNRPGDISIGDCRGIDKIDPSFGSDDGASLVLINSSKGETVFDEIKEKMYVVEVPLQAMMQPPMREPSKPNARRKLFWEIYKSKGYKKAVDAVFGPMYPIKYWVKKLLKK